MDEQALPPGGGLSDAVGAVAPGAWAVGVSGGADSVALLALLHDRLVRRGDLRLHVVHLNHQTRGESSDADARLVRDLAERRGLPCTVALRSDVEPGITKPPSNPSARYRAARLALFRRVVADHGL